MSSIDDFFAEHAGGGGIGIPSIDIDKVGDSVVGEILDVQRGHVTEIGTTDAKLNKNGETMPQLVVTLQTELRNWEGANKPATDEDGNPKPPADDDGKRRHFIKYGSNVEILAKALAAADAKGSDMVEGSKLAIKLDSLVPMSKGAMKVWAFQFKKAPSSAADDAFAEVEAAKPESKKEATPAAGATAPSADSPAADPWGAEGGSPF